MKATFIKLSFLILVSMLMVGCSSRKTIVNGLQERDANEIIVLLNSKNIDATKVQSAQGAGAGGGASKVQLWDIEVPNKQAIEAMNYLNQAGLPRKRSESLLELFGTSGLVPSEMQEKVRYQAGLAEQIANTIKQMDGVLDAHVIISFPEENPLTGKSSGPITASVYVKHNGVLDDPNRHLREKIQRLVSASISGLSYDNVTVIGDRSQLTSNPVITYPNNTQDELVTVWSIELAQTSLFRFRLIFILFFTITFVSILACAILLWKLFATVKDFGLSDLLKLKQIEIHKTEAEPKEEKKEEKEASDNGIDNI